MACLSKDKIQAANDVKMEKVLVPEWADGDPEAYVMVRTMTAGQRDKWEESNLVRTGDGRKLENYQTNLKDYRARLCVASMCDDEGQHLFTMSDVEILSSKSSEPIDRIVAVSQRINGLTSKEIEAAEKNSSPDQTATLPLN